MEDLMKSDLSKVEENTQKQNTPEFDLKYFPKSTAIINTLNDMFSEQTHEDKAVQRAKEMLGKDYSTEDIKSIVASYEYLIQNWLEDYERQIFNDKTLKELLQSF